MYSKLLKKITFALYISIILSGCSHINKLIFLQPSNIAVSSQEAAIKGRVMMAAQNSALQSLINPNMDIENVGSTENEIIALSDATVCINDMIKQEKKENIPCVTTNSDGSYTMAVSSLDEVDGQILGATKQIGTEVIVILSVIDKSNLENNADPFTTGAAIMARDFISEYSTSDLDSETRKEILNNLKVSTSQFETELKNKPLNELIQFTKVTLSHSDTIDLSNLNDMLNDQIELNRVKINSLKEELSSIITAVKGDIEDAIKNPTTTGPETETEAAAIKLSGEIIFSDTLDGDGTSVEVDSSLVANAEVCLFDLLTNQKLQGIDCVMTDINGRYELNVPSIETVDASLIVAVKEVGTEINMVTAIINKEAPVMQVNPKTTVSTTFVIDMINEKEDYVNNDFITLDETTKQSVMVSAKQYYNELNIVLESETVGEFDAFTKMPSSGVDFSELALSSIRNFFKNQKEITQPMFDQLNNTLETNEEIQNTKNDLQVSTGRIEQTSTIINSQGTVQLVDTGSQTMIEFGSYLANLPDTFPDAKTGEPYEYIAGIVDGLLIHLTISDQPAGLTWIHATDTNEVVLYGFPNSTGQFPIRIIFTHRVTGATVEKDFTLTVIEGVNQPPTDLYINPNPQMIPESIDTTYDLIVGSVQLHDDNLGYNILELGGVDAHFFELDMINQTINLKAGIELDYESNKQSYDIELILTDETLSTEFVMTTNFTLVVTDSNEAPIIHDNPVLELVCTENSQYQYVFDIDDPDTDDLLTVTVTGDLPAGIVFDSDQHTLQGIPVLGTGGIYPIMLTVTDHGQLTVSKYFNLVVQSSLLSIEQSYNHEITNPKAMVLDESNSTLYVINDNNSESTVYGIDVNLISKTIKGTLNDRADDFSFNESTNSLYVSNRTGSLDSISIDPWQIDNEFNAHVGGTSVGQYGHNIANYGNSLYIAQGMSCYIQKINLSHTNLQHETVFGDYCSSSGKDGIGVAALFSNIHSMIINHLGDTLFIAENNKIRKVDISNDRYSVSTVSPHQDNETFRAITVDNTNTLYGGYKTVEKISYYFDNHQLDQNGSARLIYRSDPILSESVFDGRDIIDIAISQAGNKLYILDSQFIYIVDLP